MLWERRRVTAPPSGGEETSPTEALYLKDGVVMKGRSWILSQGILFGCVWEGGGQESRRWRAAHLRFSEESSTEGLINKLNL